MKEPLFENGIPYFKGNGNATDPAIITISTIMNRIPTGSMSISNT
jgi:hypothetical protein